jgi:hypothetical protein
MKTNSSGRRLEPLKVESPPLPRNRQLHVVSPCEEGSFACSDQRREKTRWCQAAKMTENLTNIVRVCMWLSMGRKLHIHIEFEKTRLSNELLHTAYELVVPVVSRINVGRTPWGKECEHQDKYGRSKRNIKAEDRQ